jgi:dihydroneopterin triphosphate diphosphatase
MARSPLQAIVIPFRATGTGTVEFAVFHRADDSMWHFVSGGAEDSESAFEAAVREAAEEAGIPRTYRWLSLDSMASVPRAVFPLATHWPPDLFVVTQRAFAVDATEHDIVLSHEHDEVRWLEFNRAMELPTWESNRVALWELNERLKMGAEQAAGADAEDRAPQP